MEIRRATTLTSKEIEGQDFSFEISAEVAKPYEQLNSDEKIVTTSIPAFTKTYGFEESDYENLDKPDMALFTIVQDDKVYGYACALHSWNNMVVIEDIELDVSIRGRGWGRKLFQEVITWTRERGLSAIRIETQSNNVAACCFWKRLGFKFRGYDEFLYKATPENRDETALFWYYLLE